MDLRLRELERELEHVTDILFRMCREHPEVCPHDYRWISKKALENGEKVHYVCRLCGDEKEEIVDKMKYLRR